MPIPAINQGQCFPTGESRQSRLNQLNEYALTLSPLLKDPATREAALERLRAAAQNLCLDPSDAESAAQPHIGGNIGPQIRRPDGTDPQTPRPPRPPVPGPGQPHALPYGR